MACTKVLDEPFSTSEKSFDEEIQEWIEAGIIDEETNIEPESEDSNG